MTHVPRSARQRAAAFLLICLTATWLVPAAVGWGAKGTWEPDTARDVGDHWMFQTPDNAAGSQHKVYFNGFVGVCEYPECTSFSPNSALLQSRFHTEQGELHVMLGVWRDCNNDGMMGLGDQGLWEYRAELLATSASGATICPPQAFDPLNRAHAIVHNDGAWIHEFVPIQWKSWITQDGFNVFSIKDNASRVWVDGGLPEDDLSGGGGGGCWINPQPRGTFHNVGGLLYYGDCFDGYLATDTIDLLGTDIKTSERDTYEPITKSWVNVTGVDTGIGLDNLGLGQVSFSDASRIQWKSHSILNVEPWGEESDSSYVHAWDCSQGTQSIDVDLTPAGQAKQHVANVSTPSPTLGPTSGSSLAGTANDTGAGLDQCHRRDAASGGRGGSLARTPYSTESDLSNTQAVPGKSSTTVFAPNEAARPGGPLSLVDKRTPPDDGVHATDSSDFWVTNIDTIGDLSTAGYITYYGYVSPGAVSAYNLLLPNAGSTGSYGAAACGGHTSGVYLGWNCDATQWFINPADNKYDPPRAGSVLGPGADAKGVDISAKVGSPYDLRDIDCVDMAIQLQRDTGLTPRNIQDLTANTIHDSVVAGEESLAPTIQQVDPAFEPTDPPTGLIGGGSHNC